MIRLHRIFLATTAAVLVTGGVMSTGAEAKCVRAGAQATMVTEDLAKYSATTVLKNSIALKGAKAKGPVVVKCMGGPVLPTCTARQLVCS
jgi:hypothetical protein